MSPQPATDMQRLFPLTTAELAIPRPGDRRSSLRRLVNSGAALREQTLKTYPIDVMDVSQGGCRIRTSVDLELGESVWLKFAGFELKRAKVLWCEDGQTGCQFHVPLYEADLDIIAGRETDGCQSVGQSSRRALRSR